MTELQYGLIGLGVAAVAGVLAYNKWQERKHRQVAKSVLKGEHADVLLDPETRARPAPAAADEKVEPVLGEPEIVDRREPVLAEPQPEDFVDDERPVAGAPVAPPPAAEPEIDEDEPEAVEVSAPDVPARLLDPRLDFIVVMELVEPAAAIDVLRSQRDALERVARPVIWVGFNERTREWERMRPEADMAYRRLRIGLQLADRRGPASEADVAVFATAMRQLADELLAVADMPPQTPALDQAVALDRFCADVDLQIGVNLVSRGTPFSGTKLRALAEAAGMTLEGDGAFTRRDDEGRAQFTLANLESMPLTPDSIRTLSSHGLTFVLDVPRVDHGERVFMQMIELARRFADTLQGTLVDDNRQPLGEPQLDHIRREFVAKPQAEMARYGLPAGSPQALRLFS